MKSNMLTRVGLALACLVSPLTAVLSLTARPAAADTTCHDWVWEPGWTDQTLGALNGSSEAICGNTYAVVRVEVKMQEWTSLGWDDVNETAAAKPHDTWAYATTYFNCSGLGDWGFRTAGYATGVMDTGWSSQEGWNYSTGYIYHCPNTPPLPITRY